MSEGWAGGMRSLARGTRGKVKSWTQVSPPHWDVEVKPCVYVVLSRGGGGEMLLFPTRKTLWQDRQSVQWGQESSRAVTNKASLSLLHATHHHPEAAMQVS